MHTPPDPKTVPKALNVVVTGVVGFLFLLNAAALIGFLCKLSVWCFHFGQHLADKLTRNLPPL